MKIEADAILNAVIATGTGESRRPIRRELTFQAVGITSAGAGSATIDVEVSNDGDNWEVAGTITLTLSTTSSSDGFASNAPWKFVQGNVTAISGTDATVSLYMAAEY